MITVSFVSIFLTPTAISSSVYAADQNQTENQITFLWPTDPITITQRFSAVHPAIDISDSTRARIYATDDGRIEFTGWDGGYGNKIVIDHQDGYKSLYGHLSKIEVIEGQEVRKGQEIGRQGNTGHTRGVTGIHLHFEISKDGIRINPLLLVQPNGK